MTCCSPMIIERQAELALHLVVGGAGDQNAAGRAKLLQARGYVDTIAEQVLALDHHVTKVDADAKDDAALGRNFILPRSYAFLNGDRAGDASTTEPNSTMAPSPMSLTIRPLCSAIRGSINSERSARIAASVAGLVSLDQARIADNVGRHDGSEPPLCPDCRHGVPSLAAKATHSQRSLHFGPDAAIWMRR